MALLTIDYDRCEHAAVGWLLRSIDACESGSSVGYRLFRGWGLPYPETTGYLIPTLYRYASRNNRPDIEQRTTRMAEWLLEVQATDGSFPGGVWNPARNKPPSVFNTGQVILGLMDIHLRSGESKYLDAARRAGLWLTKVQDPDGLWRSHAYRPRFSPAYYAGVCWPMLMAWRATGDCSIRSAAVNGLAAVMARRTAHGSIADWGFWRGKPGFTHTIGYTLRGLIESAELLDDRCGVGELAVEACGRLLERYRERGRLAGAYNLDWSGNYWYQCLTGNCQIALCWIRLFDWTADPRWMEAARLLVDETARRQLLSKMLPPSLYGALPGSYPIWGRYLTLRLPNWAAKFFVDSIVAVRDGHGSQHG